LIGDINGICEVRSSRGGHLGSLSIPKFLFILLSAIVA
jgi:hypothetical protein